jgi:hypothetical protein
MREADDCVRIKGGRTPTLNVHAVPEKESRMNPIELLKADHVRVQALFRQHTDLGTLYATVTQWEQSCAALTTAIELYQVVNTGL